MDQIVSRADEFVEAPEATPGYDGYAAATLADTIEEVLEFVSGFRDQPRETSYHYLGSAMDLRVRGISVRELRDFVRTLDTGGMGLGLYPRVGFIHVDVRPEPSYYWVDWSGHSRPKRSSRKVPRS